MWARRWNELVSELERWHEFGKASKHWRKWSEKHINLGLP